MAILWHQINTLLLISWEQVMYIPVTAMLPNMCIWAPIEEIPFFTVRPIYDLIFEYNFPIVGVVLWARCQSLSDILASLRFGMRVRTSNALISHLLVHVIQCQQHTQCVNMIEFIISFGAQQLPSSWVNSHTWSVPKFRNQCVMRWQLYPFICETITCPLFYSRTDTLAWYADDTTAIASGSWLSSGTPD